MNSTSTGQSQPSRRKLGEILVEARVVDELQLSSALGHQRQWGGRLGNILIDLHFIDDVTLAKTLSQQLSLELVDLSTVAVDLEVVRLVPQTVAERHNIFPVRVDPSRQTLIIAFSDPTNLAAVDEVRFQTGKTIGIAVAPEGQIAQAIRRYYGGEEPTLTDAVEPKAALFGNVNEFLAASDDEDLAELEPIPSESQISLNIRDLGLSPVPLVAPAAKPAGGDAMAGFFQGAAASPAARVRPPAPPPGLPQIFRASANAASASAPVAHSHGSPPLVSPPGLGVASPRRADSDILARAIDLSKKTVEGFVPPPDLLRGRSSTALPVAEPAPPDAPPDAAPNFSDSDFGRAFEGLDGPLVAPAAPLAQADSEAGVAQALARLLIEKGIIQESELLAKLAKE